MQEQRFRRGRVGGAPQPQVSRGLSPGAAMEAGGGLQSGQGALMEKSPVAGGDSAGHPTALVLNAVLMGTQVRWADDTVWGPSSPPTDLHLYLRETSQTGLRPRRHRQRRLRAAGVPQAPLSHRGHHRPFGCSPGRAVWSSSGLWFKKVLKPRIRGARRPAAKCDGSVTILKRSMNIACGSTYWSLGCTAAWVRFNRRLSGNASKREE